MCYENNINCLKDQFVINLKKESMDKFVLCLVSEIWHLKKIFKNPASTVYFYLFISNNLMAYEVF